MASVFNWLFGKGTRKRKYKIAVEPSGSELEHYVESNAPYDVKVRRNPKSSFRSAEKSTKKTNPLLTTNEGFNDIMTAKGLRKTKKQRRHKATKRQMKSYNKKSKKY